jgi:hypothetical protein
MLSNITITAFLLPIIIPKTLFKHLTLSRGAVKQAYLRQRYHAIRSHHIHTILEIKVGKTYNASKLLSAPELATSV